MEFERSPYTIFFRIFGGLLFVLVSIFSILVALGWQLDFGKKAEFRQTAIVDFLAKYNDLELYFDGELVADSIPFIVRNVNHGVHQVFIQKEGYRDWFKIFDVDPGEALQFNEVVLVPNDLGVFNVLEKNNVESLFLVNDRLVVFDSDLSVVEFYEFEKDDLVLEEVVDFEDLKKVYFYDDKYYLVTSLNEIYTYSDSELNFVFNFSSEVEDFKFNKGFFYYISGGVLFKNFVELVNADSYLFYEDDFVILNDGNLYIANDLVLNGAGKVEFVGEFDGKEYFVVDEVLYLYDGESFLELSVLGDYVHSEIIKGEYYIWTKESMYKIDSKGGVGFVYSFDKEIEQINTFGNSMNYLTTSGSTLEFCNLDGENCYELYKDVSSYKVIDRDNVCVEFVDNTLKCLNWSL